jgi:hypothetical protein
MKRTIGLGVGLMVFLVACGDSGSAGAGGTTSSSHASSSVATGSQASTGTGSTCQAMCESQHAAGYTLLSQIVVEKCGCDTTATPFPPCNMQCMSDPACTDAMPNKGTPVVGSACEMCILAEGDKGANSQCAAGAAFGMTCQNDADCKALVMCVTACLTGG